jgi:DNA-binding response OmpR family regulator
MTLVALVEDHAELRDYTARFLRGEGFGVIELADSEELREINEIPDLYIIDLNLPTISGYELIERIRLTAEQVGIIVVSARDRSEDIAKGYEVGADVYLAKPVDPDVLLAAVKRIEARTLMLSANESVCAVDRSRQLLHWQGKKVRLSAAEVRLLYQLSLAGQRGLERWEVMELFDMDPNQESSNALEVRISRLRNKFRQLGIKGGCIGAVRQRGYCLLEELRFDKWEVSGGAGGRRFKSSHPDHFPSSF